jgi:hypothetical protein
VTDYEVLMAFSDIANSSQASYMNFVTIVFAFIVAGYFVSDKLSQKMASLLTILFTLVAFQEAASTMLFTTDFLGLIPEIKSREGLQFHGAFSVSSFFPPMYIALHFVTLILAYIGSIIFFYHQRHQGLKKS